MRNWLLIFLFTTTAFASEIHIGERIKHSLYDMSIEEKVGQLFVIPFDPALDESHLAQVEALIKKCHIGGLMTKGRVIDTHRFVLKRLQNYAIHPMLVACDAEWGINMRMPECPPLPRNMTLGAIPHAHSSIVHKKVGKELGKQVRLLGVQMVLGPVADVNTNPDNPIIGTRSFGDSAISCQQLTSQLMDGIIESGVIPTLKHFPGHGDVNVDSHVDLPVSHASLAQLKKSHLIPFSICRKRNDCAIMSAHILFPNIDRQIATFSSTLIEDLLRCEWEFDGLVISDALNMKALTNSYTPEEVALLTFSAGHDLLLYGTHIKEQLDNILQEMVPRAYNALLTAVKEGHISIERLDQSVRRIQRAKEKSDFTIYSQDIGNPSFSKELYESALTMIGDFPTFQGQNIALFEVGKGSNQILTQFDRVDGMSDVSQYDHVIALITSKDPKALEAYSQLECASKGAIVMTSPYVLQALEEVPLLLLYENNAITQQILSQWVKGLIPQPQGQLPVQLSALWHRS